MVAITASTLFTPLERIDHPIVVIEGGLITGIQTRDGFANPTNARVIDLCDAILSPGFIDMHIHGAGGYDVMSPSDTGLAAMESVLAQHGSTSYFPTTVTAPMDITLSALDRLADEIEACEKRSPDHVRAQPVGIHIEGPFLSHERRGVHPPENLVRPSITVFDRLWQAARGHIKIMTIAPEVDGALEVIGEAAKRGVVVSMGHSDATLEQAQKGMGAGARHATHTFNAMRPLNHREPGILGLVLTEPSITADIILDGIHVDPVIARLFLQMKGHERSVLISDGLSATGMADGDYRLGALDVHVEDGRCLAGNTLAGSVLTLDRAVRNAMHFGKIEARHALSAATLNPATITGIASSTGKLAPGVQADIVVMNSKYEIMRTIIQGRGIEA